MIIHPNGKAKTALTNVDEKMEQMHALDIRIAKLYELHGDFAISEDIKVHRQQVEVKPDETGWFHLKPMTTYAFDSLHEVEMAEGEKAQVEPRSTFTRNGIIIGSAIYDAGYKGGINGYIANLNIGKARIKLHTRVGQFVVEEAETVKLYDGDYQSKEVKKDETTTKTTK